MAYAISFTKVRLSLSLSISEFALSSYEELVNHCMRPPNPEAKIYLTYKTRMTTEVRLRRTSLICHAMLAWYSLCFIILSFLDISDKFTISHAGIVSGVGSTAIFGLSLFIYGERYSEKANEFKSCYLKLKELYESSLSTSRKMATYAKILEQYENQTDADYDNMLYDAWMRDQKLENASGPVSISTSTLIKVAVTRIVKLIVLIAFIFAPVAVGTFWIRLT